MKKPKQYRQGDILLVAVDRLPNECQRLNHKIVAEGEATGHNHQFHDNNVVLFEEKGTLFIEVILGESTLVHEEHGPIKVPKGTYKVVKQREYVPSKTPSIRYVLD